jgi:hypothetical protein
MILRLPMSAPEKPEPPHLLRATLRSVTVEWISPHENGTAITGEAPGAHNVVSSFHLRMRGWKGQRLG